MLVNYLWNMELSAALYPALCTFEIVLRNAIHDAASGYFGSDRWFEMPGVLNKDEQNVVNRVLDNLGREGKPPLVGRVVSNLMLGFWVSLLSKGYENVDSGRPHRLAWHGDDLALIRQTFPYVPRRSRSRQHIHREFNQIRLFRNSVFHHEAIWDRSDLASRHDSLLEAIDWISPSASAGVTLNDRFDEQLRNGRSVIASRLRERLGFA